jgi:transposase
MTGIDRLLWPRNSPDLNMIEPCWPLMKRHTTKKGALTRKPEAERAWFQSWEVLEQWRIQSWNERIPRHIQEVIRLERDNSYREGAEDQARTGKRPRDYIVR